MKLFLYNIGRILVLVFLSTNWAQENDRDFTMCGKWVHREGKQTLSYDLKPGCTAIVISANESTLSVRGSITAVCFTSKIQNLNIMRNVTSFCVFWEPLWDQLMVQVDGKNFTLCSAKGVQTSYCTSISPGRQNISKQYGIINGSVHGDILSNGVMAEYEFKGDTVKDTETLCAKTNLVSNGPNRACSRSIEVEMKEDSKEGINVTLPVPKNVPANKAPSVFLPSCIRPPKANKIKVVCTFHQKSTLSQMSPNEILKDVVEITVENEIIRNLPEPVRIKLHHSGIQANQTRKCVSWDTRIDKEIKWREEGCTTIGFSSTETECLCNHLTYFAVLVQLNPEKAPRHLEALTFITAVGCAVSIISCVILFVSLCRQRRATDHSNLVHRGLVVALFFLCVLFILTGTIANVKNEVLCQFMGGLLHYMLLSVLCWMAVEVIHTFWMIYMVFSPSPKPWIWYMVGFGFPALPVIILASVGNVYGERTISPDNLTKPYRMCWMTDSRPAQIAHFTTNMGLLAVVVSSGFVMLSLVMWKIHNRDEWRRNRVAFLSIWGLSCLFGTTWSLAFLSFELSETGLFLFCIINSLQGFFLMLRFYGLERLRKNPKYGTDFSSSSGSTRQHMLQSQERSYT